jgi:hypothetical protein
MLATVEPAAWKLSGSAADFTVSIAGAEIVFDLSSPAFGDAFERLAFAVEARISFERASAMLPAATGAGPLPLWLVSGSDVLAKWLAWSGSTNALRKVLRLSDVPGQAPVCGDLARRARRELGQHAAKIRVRQGMAVAERIDLADRPLTIAELGDRARIRIDAMALPEALLIALQDDDRRNDRRSVAEIIDHPFIAATDLKLIGMGNDRGAVTFEVASHVAPLAPVPKEAWAVLPRDADPSFPWRPTPRERREHDRLVEAGRRLVGGASGTVSALG